MRDRNKGPNTLVMIVLPVALSFACSPSIEDNDGQTPSIELDSTPTSPSPMNLTSVVPHPYREGDAAKGWEVVRYGNYSGSGFPYDTWIDLVGENSSNILEREGDNAIIGPSGVAFDAPNGARVVGSTCMTCHAGKIDDTYIIGLGNSHNSFVSDLSSTIEAFRVIVNRSYGEDSPEAVAFDNYARGYEAFGPYAVAPFVGVAPAFIYEEVSGAYRDPSTLMWTDSPSFDIPPTNYSSDTPPLWNVAKKNSWYYNGMGRGDKSRLAMQISIAALFDSHQAADIDASMPDLYAWLRSLEAPSWPKDIDDSQLELGLQVFGDNCSMCHGTYGESETYPNLLVGTETVGTDPAYAQYFLDTSGLPSWINNSWYGADGLAWLEPTLAYAAPPLDGVWATAPYLHNGSIPNMWALLKSQDRPQLWQREAYNYTYDYDAVGWPYVEMDDAVDTSVYDTRLEGYGNQGHTFGDTLSDYERWALIEYIKTL